MNMSADNIIVSSCQYTPVYFIEDPGVSQARSYVLATNNQSVDKPACESLKRFYENSGKLESNLTLTDSTIKPRIIKKNDTNVVGNNLKLASFLLPKCEPKNELCKPVELAPVNSVVLKPVYIANNLSVNNVNSPNQTPKIDVNSRLVKLSKTKRNVVRSQTGKILPKIKPKENSPSSNQTPIAVQAVQPVQLIKFGETYHSLNQLSTDQMQMVNHALKMLNNTQSNPPESTCDPAANTKFIYKVVSQKDFAESKVVDKQVTAEIKKEPIEIEEPKIIDEEEPKVTFEAKVTRSGRVVKLPKNIILDNSPSKPKKRPVAIVACLQCSSKFSSPQRLHRHYENHPSHVPSNLHNNLFHCLVAMVSAGSEVERASILLQQLQLLMDRLQACMPCLLKNDHGMENINTISDEIGKLLGINPGKYNLNMEALGCVKDKDGYCSHNPRPQISISDNIKPHVILENIENGVSKGASNILKVNLQDRRPTILRKVECRKQKLERNSHNVNGKKIKLSQDIPVDKNSNSIELDNLVALLNNTAKTDNKESKIMDEVVLNDRKEVTQDTLPEKAKKVTKPAQIQFHSAHFDIRSSPIKPTSTVFRKFQINPEKMTKYIEIIRPIQLNQLAQGVEMTNNTDKNINNINTQEFFSDTNVITSKETENLNCTSKNWCEDPHFMEQNNLINSHTDNFIKPNAAIEPALLHVKNGVRATNIVANESVLKQVESDSVNKVTNIESLLNSQVQVNKITNQTSFIKPSILIEPLIPPQNDHGTATDKISNQIDNDDFMKSDILIDQPFLHTPDCKVINEITNRNHDFIKSNILTEPVLIHSRDAKIDKFADQANSFMTSDLYIDSTLQHSDIDHGNRITDVTESNEIDVDLNSNQGQSIISFLESLGNELAYENDTETDSRNNIDFQLDLFSFNNSS